MNDMEPNAVKAMKDLLSMFSEEQLQFMINEFKEVFANGFGSVTVVVENGHPDVITPSVSKKFPKPPKEYKAE